MQLPANCTCIGCKFLEIQLDAFSCKAFPRGIPEEILTGEHDHTKPFKDDNGIRFEPIKGSDSTLSVLIGSWKMMNVLKT